MASCIRLLLLLSICTITAATSSWSVNNFMMTGPKAFMMSSESVAAGGMMGIEECQHQFKWDRWNCPQSSVNKLSENKLPSAIREAAFVSAIKSAGVMYTLTLNCSMGHFDGCGCDDTKTGSNGGPDWKWGGCSDNVGFGERIGKQFVDSMETGNDARAIVNLHNNEAGRRAVKKTLHLSCKCHGVSGSCSIRTCWKELADFREIGDHLKRKYFKAVIVDAQNGQLRKGNNARNERDIPEISKNDLVFLESSLDFCRAAPTYGSAGTLGRECSRPKTKNEDNRWERKSCKRLCSSCGFKVRKQMVQVTSTCNCKFHWCCEVKCEECTQTVEKLTCVSR